MEELQALVAQIDRNQLVGKRDAAVILVGWWTSMRRSELVALQFDDVKTVRGGGIALHTGRSKTDQEGEGMWRGFDRKGGELCPVEALDAWMSELTNAGHTTGPIFRGFTAQGVIRRTALHAQEVARIVKQLARAAGLDPKKYGGHSLRAGHITEAILQDVPTARIMAQTGHRSATTLQRYYRAADPVARGSASAIKVPSSETKR
jgi:integrase